MITTKPWGLELAMELGLKDRIVRTNNKHRGAYVLHRGTLERIPNGFSVVAPSNYAKLRESNMLSSWGLSRALWDKVLPKAEPSDESLGSFVRRRFGSEVLERLAQPLAGGIYGAHPDELSLRATMPRFLDLEQSDRSVSTALARQAKAAEENVAQGARYGAFVCFDEGMQVLADAAYEAVADSVRTHAVVSVEQDGHRYRVTNSGVPELFDALILAVPAPTAAELLQAEEPELCAHLSAIRYGSASIVSLVYRKADIGHPLDAFGFVVPSVERRAVMASTWSSIKWPGRAPDDKLLLRAFIGGHTRESLTQADEDSLVATAHRELSRMMGIHGSWIESRVDRYIKSMPRYHIGHIQRVKTIQRLIKRPNLALAGNAYTGVGIPDSIHAGQRAAERVLSLTG